MWQTPWMAGTSVSSTSSAINLNKKVKEKNVGEGGTEDKRKLAQQGLPIVNVTKSAGDASW